MSGKGSQNLANNKRGPDVMFVGNHDVSSLKSEWFMQGNFAYERFSLNALQGASGAPGGKVTIEIDNKGPRLGKCELLFDREPYTHAINGATVTPSDWEAYLCLADLQWEYNNKIFYTESGKSLLLRSKTDDSIERRSAKSVLCGGGLSVAERGARASQKVSYLVDLEVPWSRLGSEIILGAIPNKIFLHVNFNTVDRYCKQSAAGGSTTFSRIRLRTTIYHNEASAIQGFISKTKEGSGFTTKTTSLETHKEITVPAGTVEFRQPLNNLKNSIYQIRALLQPSASVQGLAADPLNFVVADSWWLEDGGTAITDTFDNADIYTTDIEMYPLGDVGLQFMNIYFCHKGFGQLSRTNGFGSRNMSTYNNPELILKFNSPTTSEMKLTVEGHAHNIFIQKDGDLRKFLL